MPAAAVASLTPAMAGMSGTSVGASGETEEDMRGFRQWGGKRSISSRASKWERAPLRMTVSSLPKQGTHNHRHQLLKKDISHGAASSAPRRMGPRFRGDASQLLL